MPDSQPPTDQDAPSTDTSLVERLEEASDGPLSLSEDAARRAIADIFDNPDKYDPDTVFPIFAALAGETPTPRTPEDADPDLDHPVVPTQLIIQRANVYRDEGVDTLHALTLALEDAIDTADEAETHNHTGPVGGLASN